jgi:hypothetical protein
MALGYAGEPISRHALFTHFVLWEALLVVGQVACSTALVVAAVAWLRVA